MTLEDADVAAVEFVGSGVALEVHTGIVEIQLGTAIDLEAAKRLLRDADIAGEGASRIVVDARYKSFESLEAQRLISERKHDLKPGQELALWTRADQLSDAKEYAPSSLSVFSDPSDTSAPSWLSEQFEERRSQLHLIAGSTGAGKSTYAMRLAKDLGAHYAAIDDWMVRLFGPDRPKDAGFDWYMPRVQRCQDQILEVASGLHDIGTPSVLDLGLTTKTQRQQVLDWAETRNIRTALHYVDANAECRWRRVERRNRERGTTYRLEVTRQMFDFVEGMFEAPTAEENPHFVHFRS